MHAPYSSSSRRLQPATSCAQWEDVWPDEVGLLTEPSGRVALWVGWYAHTDDQRAALQNAARLLLRRFGDDSLYYIRCDDVDDPTHDPDYPRPITVAELATEAFEPSLCHQEQPYRYRLVA